MTNQQKIFNVIQTIFHCLKFWMCQKVVYHQIHGFRFAWKTLSDKKKEHMPVFLKALPDNISDVRLKQHGSLDNIALMKICSYLFLSTKP